MAKTTTTTETEVRASVASIYSELLDKRRLEREEKEAKKREAIERRHQEKEEKKLHEDGSKMSKKERREAELNAWKEIIIGLTGDDLEYSSEKKEKKKYRQWIGEEDGAPVLTPKPKKAKKRNYRKEFEPELVMLKTIVADQNRFTADLQKRFQNAAGPATKDANPLNKTLVELAAAVNASRSNSLGLLREIGNIKKTIADLYMKQKKMDAEGSGSTGFNSTDVGLMGSSIAASMFGDNAGSSSYIQNTGASAPATPSENPYASQPSSTIPVTVTPIQSSSPVAPVMPAAPVVENFDPSTWGGPDLAPNDSTYYENIPHSVVVEWNKQANTARFKAIRNDSGEELTGCPVPTVDPFKLAFNEKDLTVKGEFDENYKLEIIE